MTTQHRPHSAWLQRLAGSNPLLRRSDRIQARLLVLAIIVAICAIPMCIVPARAHHAAVLSRTDAQLRTLQPVDAVVLPPTITTSPSRMPSASRTVRVQWKAAFEDRTADVRTREIARPGDHLRVWLDAQGHPTAAPLSETDAVSQSVAYGIALWLSVAGAGALFYLVMRRILDRRRYAAWEHEWRRLSTSDGGWANRDR